MKRYNTTSGQVAPPERFGQQVEVQQNHHVIRQTGVDLQRERRRLKAEDEERGCFLFGFCLSYPEAQNLLSVAVSCDGDVHLHLKVEICRGNIETVTFNTERRFQHTGSTVIRETPPCLHVSSAWWHLLRSVQPDTTIMEGGGEREGDGTSSICHVHVEPVRFYTACWASCWSAVIGCCVGLNSRHF